MSPNDVNRFSSLSNSLSKKKSEIIPASKRVDLENLLSGCLEELQFKKEQIVKKSVQDIDSISIVNDSNGSEPLFGIPTKKRKRKHKKKSKVLETSSFEETNKSDLIAMDSLDSSSNHIHFSDEDSKEETHDKSTLKVNGNTVEEFRSSLLHLVNKPASQKVFSRKSDSTVTTTPDSEDVEAATLEPTSVNVDEYKSVPIDLATFVPKVGDLISFKKIKLGNDYTPQQSNEIVGEVSTVEESAGSHLVVFTIKEGAEEFEDPTGKFSLACEEKFEGDKILTAEIRWNDVLEPHLKRRV
nr:uncharacterized protein LOC106677140 [Halyomorpha halys]